MKATQSGLIVPAGVILGAVGMVASSVPLYTSHVTATAYVQARTETVRSLNDLWRFTEQLESTETLQRHVLLTGDTAALLRYRSAARNVSLLLDSLRTAERWSEPAMRTLLVAVDSLATRRLALLDSVAAVRFGEGLDSAVNAVRQSGGVPVMAELQAKVDALIAMVEDRLESQRGDLVRELDYSKSVLQLGSAASVLLIVAMVGLLQHQRARRRGAEAALGRANAELTERNEALSESRRTLEKQSAVLEGIIRNLGIGVMVADVDDELLIVNPAAAEILGISAKNRGRRQTSGEYDLFPADGTTPIPVEDRPLARAIRGETIDGVELRLRRSDRSAGSDLWLVVSARPLRLPDGAVIGGVAAFTDVTARKQTENELRRAKLAAEAASRARGEFLANMSHEIRTPLNGVLGMIDLALMTEDDNQRTRYLNGAVSAANALLEVINDILDFSRIEAGQMEMEQIDFHLRPLVEDVLESFVAAAQKKSIELTPLIMSDVPNALTGDPGRIRQVLRNLVSNALKFTEQGAVLVRVDRTQETAGTVTIDISVTDTGIGIPAEVRDRIFEPFQQADASTTRRYGGSGLGLAIVAELVALMRGRVWLESEVGKGTTFHVVLELRKNVSDAGPAHADLDDLEGLPVLIVDDSDVSSIVLHGMFTAWRMRPVNVTDAPQALALLRASARAGEPFRLAVIDSHMPGMDGFELTRRIREDPALAGLMIVLLTTSGQRGDAARCRELGIAAYLGKPLRQSDLLDAILTAQGRSMGLDDSRQLVTVHSIREHRSGLRVLLAEDNKFNQMVAQEMLRRWGHDVTTVGTGRAALHAAQQEAFDLILMDVQMPEMDGLAATRAIRKYQKAAGAYVPIVAMTALALPGDREACLDAGMDDYVAKPIRSADLLEVVQRTVPQRRPLPHPEEPNVMRQQETPPARLDRERLLAEAGGDMDLLRRMATIFHEQSAALLRRLRTALANRDPAEVREAAHALKGSVGFWATGDAYDAARALELRAREGSLENAEAERIVLETGLSRLQAELDRFMKSGGIG